MDSSLCKARTPAPLSRGALGSALLLFRFRFFLAALDHAVEAGERVRQIAERIDEPLVHGIRAVNCITTQFAELAREHNNANIVTLSGRFVELDENERILDAFLSTDFGGGRHEGRVAKIMALEN